MTRTPIDAATGLQSGIESHSSAVAIVVDVLVGYLVTHRDGAEVRFGDKGKAEFYVRAHRCLSIEPMFCKRTPLPVDEYR